jgi:hypothetical protein
MIHVEVFGSFAVFVAVGVGIHLLSLLGKRKFPGLDDGFIEIVVATIQSLPCGTDDISPLGCATRVC